MGETPVLGFPIADASEAPANHAAHMQALGSAIETFTVMRFADAAERDQKVAAPTAGMEAWLNSPGVYEWYDGAAWQRRNKPVSGGNETYTYSVRPETDVTFSNDGPANWANYTADVSFPVPTWARDGTAAFQAIAQVNAQISEDGDATWQFRIEWSFDAGASWGTSIGSHARGGGPGAGGGDPTEYTTTVSNSNNDANVAVPVAASNVRLRLRTQRVPGSGPGNLSRNISSSIVLWTVGFYDPAAPQPQAI